MQKKDAHSKAHKEIKNQKKNKKEQNQTENHAKPLAQFSTAIDGFLSFIYINCKQRTNINDVEVNMYNIYMYI